MSGRSRAQGPDEVPHHTHVSGNTGDAIGVGIGESKRLKTPPRPAEGAMLDDLENLPNLAPDQQEKVLGDFGLLRTRPAAPPDAVTQG